MVFYKTKQKIQKGKSGQLMDSKRKVEDYPNLSYFQEILKRILR